MGCKENIISIKLHFLFIILMSSERINTQVKHEKLTELSSFSSKFENVTPVHVSAVEEIRNNESYPC